MTRSPDAEVSRFGLALAWVMLAWMTRQRSLPQFFRDPRTGEVVLGQVPNTAIVLWFAARVLSLLWDARAEELRWIATGALLVWAVDEVVRGASPFRRALGALVLAYQIFVLVR